MVKGLISICKNIKFTIELCIFSRVGINCECEKNRKRWGIKEQGIGDKSHACGCKERSQEGMHKDRGTRIKVMHRKDIRNIYIVWNEVTKFTYQMKKDIVKIRVHKCCCFILTVEKMKKTCIKK